MSDSSSFACDFVRSVGARIDESGAAGASSANGSAVTTTQQQQDTSQQIELADELDLAHVTKLPSRSALLKSVESLASQTQFIQLGAAAASTSDARAHDEADAFLRLTYLAYAVSLDTLLQKAETLGNQAWYWSDVEDELLQTCRYFLQTFPGRLYNLAEGASRIVYSNASHTLQNASTDRSAAGLRSLLDGKALSEAWSLVRTSPTFVVASMFPATRQSQSEDEDLSKQPKLNFSLLSPRAFSPLRLTRHEARHKRKELSRQRDELATQIGRLSLAMREQHALIAHGKLREPSACIENGARLVESLSRVVGGDSSRLEDANPVERLRDVLSVRLLQHEGSAVNATVLRASPAGLGPPSTFARLWPTFVFVPTVSLVLLKVFSRNQDAIRQSLLDARETVRGFLVGWVYDPAMRLLQTVRRGEAAESLIISRESLNSDLQSLERMVTDFSREKYSLSPEELAQVSAKVKEGDLSYVLRIYEEALKTPVKSLVAGSLLRTLLIQVQKAKVDLEVAMSGIDSLLKSQQLLFGAVGIAPALGTLYVVGSWLKGKLGQASDRQGHAAGLEVRVRAWEALRRVDKLLASVPSEKGGNSGDEEARTQGLLLLDLALLRSAAGPLVANAKASKRKGTRKKLRQELLADVRELEGSQGDAPSATTADVGLGWHARRAAMDRIWRSWGSLVSLH